MSRAYLDHLEITSAHIEGLSGEKQRGTDIVTSRCPGRVITTLTSMFIIRSWGDHLGDVEVIGAANGVYLCFRIHNIFQAFLLIPILLHSNYDSNTQLL